MHQLTEHLLIVCHAPGTGLTAGGQYPRDTLTRESVPGPVPARTTHAALTGSVAELPRSHRRTGGHGRGPEPTHAVCSPPCPDSRTVWTRRALDFCGATSQDHAALALSETGTGWIPARGTAWRGGDVVARTRSAGRAWGWWARPVTPRERRCGRTVH